MSSSDLYVVDGSSFYHHSSPEVVSCDGGDLQFFSDPFSSFGDSNVDDILQELSNIPNHQNQLDGSPCINKFGYGFLSSSPPTHQMENLSLYQTAHLQQQLTNGSNLTNGYGDFLGLHGLEDKTEECQGGGFDSSYNNSSFLPPSYSSTSVEHTAKLMQRSFSSNSFDGKPGFLFQPKFDTLLESPNYQYQALSSPENNFLSTHMRRVCSTGDLQNIKPHLTTQRSFSSPLAAASECSSLMEDTNFKVGRYSAEERKERISKYRAKRTQRNFNKTIKYACRKTLADNRPRIRGRFARNDETGEIPKVAGSTREEDEDELWENAAMRGGGGGGGPFVDNFGQCQFQYFYGY
ncbi:uncharacterized protein LOC120016986 isoform X2 [Tripterygium wilfordii]|uniref:uncharacterized protein LOC120016986 isoform X2 n=1 Tax=Tripterygium wilfordii TaxID=458696 RepID=UPI0018F8600B|nr:uncharacterized protein LOC120016986 isoform X2 [Tripterygium wilfordii]